MIAWIVISAAVLGLTIIASIVLIILIIKDILELDVSVFVLNITLGLGSFIFLIIGCSLYPIYNRGYITKIADILSISRENEIEGHFTLGCGYVKEEQYYFYYYPTEKGIKLGKVKTEVSYIIETTEYTPSIYEIKEPKTFENEIYYSIYVPVGTIVTNYVLN